MKGLLLWLVLAAILAWPLTASSDWRADQIAENIAITATGATASQSSAVINKPTNAIGVVTWLKVTAGADLLLDVDMYYYSPTLDDSTSVFWFANAPSAEGITGTGDYTCAWGPHRQTNDYAAGMEDMAGLMPTRFVFTVDHGNATACSYVLYYQWLY